MRKISLKGHLCPKSLAFKQILLTMKITIFFLLFVTFQVYSENGYSQSAKISIPRSSLTVSELLSKIESQTDYLFVYNKQNVDTKRTVTVDAENKAVSEILDEAFEGTGIHYVMEGHNIVLTRNNEDTASVQQNKLAIKGIVTDTKGEPIIGANILEKGTTNGTITDIDGNFSLNVPADAILVVTYVGYQPQTISVNGLRNFNIKLEEEALTLETVVVTAMGIKKKEASLTYSTQQLGGDELTRAKDPNMINALAGKTAGVQITKSAAGLGGSAKVAIRGARSAFATGNNQPLYVIDGVPMLNNSTESTSTVIGGENDGVNRDAGDGISNLNPDDIESMNILKGASAAALYGSQAANGVILITTKKGKAGMQRITYSSNLTVDHAISLPEFQNSYGRLENGTSSWGNQASLTDYDNAGNFFNNGITAMNSVSIMTGNEKMQTYFSYANTTAKGIIDSNKLQKHNLTLRETANFFNERLKLDGNANLMTQTIKNSPSSGGYYLNPLVNVYGFPRGMDMAPYRDSFETYDTDRNMNLQNWYVTNEDGTISEWDQNPYWIKNRVTNNNKRYRAMAALTASVEATEWLTIQARGNVDYVSDKFENKMYASPSPNIAGTYEGKMNGRYVWSDNQQLLLYGDVMAMFNKTFDKFSINGAIGASINVSTVNSLMIDSKTASLYRPNVFTVANVVTSSKAGITQEIDSRRTTQSVFATAQLGWDEAIYMDITARNDWSSTLAHTNSMNSGFFYPSVGLTWILSKSLRMPDWISFSKIRGSWAQVGNDLPIGITNPADIIQAGGTIQVNDTEQRGDLKPEISNSIEFGTEWRFFSSRLGIDFTWYQTDTKNQLLRMPNPAGSLFAYRYVNAGNIQNEGWELTLDAAPVMNRDFMWKTTLNFSSNKNKIIELHEKLKEFVYGPTSFSSSYAMKLVEGGSIGDIYGKAFVRDAEGNIVYETDGDNKGLPRVEGDGNTVKVGNANPVFSMGWSHTLSYKGISLYCLIDWRYGGDILSQTQADMDMYGVSKATADARDAGYVLLEGRRIEDVKRFYKNVVGGRAGVTEYYMYDATNIRLRELSLSYRLPANWIQQMKIFHEIQLSFVGRNLFFFYKKAPFDPDLVLSTGNDNQGIDVYGMPTTRSLGFSIKCDF